VLLSYQLMQLLSNFIHGLTSVHCSTPFICKMARAASSSCCDSAKFKRDAILDNKVHYYTAYRLDCSW